MNRFCLKPKANPVFKLAQPLPALDTVPGLKLNGTHSCRAAAVVPSAEGRVDLSAIRLDEKNGNPANEAPRYNSLCKNFAFTNPSQVL